VSGVAGAGASKTGVSDAAFVSAPDGCVVSDVISVGTEVADFSGQPVVKANANIRAKQTAKNFLSIFFSFNL
jgi:hypothetical protein